MYAANKTSIGNKVDRGTDPMSYRNNLKDYQFATVPKPTESAGKQSDQKSHYESVDSTSLLPNRKIK